MRDVEIIPGILEREWTEIERKIEVVLPFANTIHLDLLDGKFAENTTFLDPAPFVKYKDKVLLELHMMVIDPLQYIEPFAKAGFTRFLGHIEHMPDQVAFVSHAEQYGEVGLALDGETPTDEITVSFTDLDVLTMMTISHAGFSHQQFHPHTLEKVKTIRSQTDDLFHLEIDGGVTQDTIKKAREAGATRFVSTGFLFHVGSTPKSQYDKLLSSLNEALE